MLSVTGVDELAAALRAMAARVDAATPRAMQAGLGLLEAKVRANLSIYSHPPGTPTPSPPGRPPAMITGHLRASIRIVPPMRTVPGTWTALLAPTAVYAAIQETGGTTGRGGRTTLPARPYMRPAVEELARSHALEALYAAAWAAALRG